LRFSFLRRPSRKRGHNLWYENALLLAVAGSIIAVIGQLAGTVIPIMYGPQDASDFTINIDPINHIAIVNESMRVSVNVTADDFHPFLRPYRFKIFLRALGAPKGVRIKFDPPEIRAKGTSYLDISSNGIFEDSSIVIQGVGADGRTRNATFYLLALPKEFQLYPLVGKITQGGRTTIVSAVGSNFTLPRSDM
jgi:hypothetical protein